MFAAVMAAAAVRGEFVACGVSRLERERDARLWLGGS